MKGKITIIAVFVLLILATFLFSVKANAQVLAEENYDQKWLEGPVNPFEADDALLRKNKINEIISRITRGDKTVLRLVTYDTFEAVHDELLRRSAGKGEDGYYREVGYISCIPAFIYGGFDNQDPKVRLKSIGFLGDWIDEIGKELPTIEKEVDRRLSSTLETRREVRYGYRVLKMKIVRLRVLQAIKRGDDQVLVTITPEDFMPLVLYEPRIRTIYLGKPGAVNIRSISLDRGVDPITGALIGDRPGRAPGLDFERICLKKEVREVRDRGEVAQYFLDTAGGVDEAVSETGRGTVIADKDEADVDWKCLRALYGGLNNRSLFVREHTARVFLNYVKGLTGNANYLVPDPPNSTKYTRVLSKEFEKLAKDPYVKRVAMVAWDNVKWAEFYYWDRHDVNLRSFIENAYYFEARIGTGPGADYNGAVPERYFTKTSSALAGQNTELTGNYRNDVKEINRLICNELYLDAEYAEEKAPEPVELRRSAVDSLFNDSRSTSGRPSIPDRHDTLRGEATYEY